MDNYTKGRVVEVDDESGHPFGHLCAADTKHMKVKAHTRTWNIVDFATKNFVNESPQRQIVVSSSANGSTKAISCAELIKQKYRHKLKDDLFQMTRIGYKTVEEFWEPKDTNLDTLKVDRKVPVIHVLLSKDPLDLTADGVQHKDTNLFGQLSEEQDSNSSQNRSQQNRSNRNKQRPKNLPKSGQKSEPKTPRKSQSEPQKS